MAAEKVAEETDYRESIRPKESFWEVIWELEVWKLCVPTRRPYWVWNTPYQDRVSIPRPGGGVYSADLKNHGAEGCKIGLGKSVPLNRQKKINGYVLFYHLLKFQIVGVSLITEKASSSELTVQRKFYHLLAM